MPAQPPLAPKIPTERYHHGDAVIDNYEWLRDKDSPAVLAHLEAENAYADEQTAHLAPLRAALFDEIKSRTQETDLSVPVREGQWWYYSRTVEGQQYGIHCRAPIAGADDWIPPVIDGPADDEADARPTRLEGEQVCLDDNVEAAGHEFYSLGSFDVSSDGRWLLYSTDTEGDERYTLRVREIATGLDLADEIPNTSAGATFDASGAYVFYTTVDESWRPDTVWRHGVGTSAQEDIPVFHEADERFWLGVGLTRSRRYLVIDASSSVTSEEWILDTRDPLGQFRVVWPREQGVEYSIEHAVIGDDDRLLIVHNKNAIDFEVVNVPVNDPAAPPRILIPHTPGIRIESLDAFSGHLIVEYRRQALPRVAVALLADIDVPEREGDFDLSHAASQLRDSVSPDWVGGWHELPFAETLFSVGAGGNPEWTQSTIRLHHSSFVTPATVYDYDTITGDLRQLKKQPVLGEYDETRYAQQREWAVAEDGTRVPISLVYRSDLVEPGVPAPTVLYGYGSYEHSIDPGFSIARVSLLDRGVVFAVAHVRGGGELGREWYEQGKELTKETTFTDFIACARHLAESGWTSPDRLVAEGGSAGGLLMGAVANLAPADFAGILAVVPFVDPLTSILDPSLPLTVIEWDEWGDPLHDPGVYALMKGYSPYENVHDGPYPRILAITSINDTRVLYVEPAKWVARLREVGAPVLLRTEMSAGHGGVSGRYESWHKRAFEYAWVLDTLGVTA